MDYLQTYKKMLSRTLDNTIRREISCVTDYLKVNENVYYYVDENLKHIVKPFMEEHSIKLFSSKELAKDSNATINLLCISYDTPPDKIKKLINEENRRNIQLLLITNNINSQFAKESTELLGVTINNHIKNVDNNLKKSVFRQATLVLLDVVDKKVKDFN